MSRLFSFLKVFLLVLLVIALVITATFIGYKLYTEYKNAPVNNIPEPPKTSVLEIPLEPSGILVETPELHKIKFKEGTFGPDDERLKYKSGSMILNIPRLDFEGPVLSVDIDGTTTELEAQGFSEAEIAQKLMEEMNLELDNGVVLFNQAQLPGSENRNVSIAGHRDYKGMEFYYIDTITDGDLLYLTYEGKSYVYEYEKTFVTTATDWDPIAVSDKSKLTLQSCDPIFAPNGDYDRIFVVADLIKILDVNVDDVPNPASGIPSEESSNPLNNWNDEIKSK